MINQTRTPVTRKAARATRPHIVGSVVTLQGADGKPFKYLWLTDRSKYPGSKVRALSKKADLTPA